MFFLRGWEEEFSEHIPGLWNRLGVSEPEFPRGGDECTRILVTSRIFRP